MIQASKASICQYPLPVPSSQDETPGSTCPIKWLPLASLSLPVIGQVLSAEEISIEVTMYC